MKKQGIIIISFVFTLVMFSSSVLGGFTLIDTLTFGGKADIQPLVTDIVPNNGSACISMYPLLHVYVESDNLFNISWSTNHSSWTACNSSCTEGWHRQRASFVNLSNTTFWWTVNVNDTLGNWNNHTFKFTTRDYSWSGWSGWWIFILRDGCSQSNPVPANNSVEITLTPMLQITVNDKNFSHILNVTWRSNSSGSWITFGVNNNIDVSGGAVTIDQINSNFSVCNTTYYWSVSLTNGTSWCNETYHFTTIENVCELLRIQASTSIFDVVEIANSIITILGISVITSFNSLKQDPFPIAQRVSSKHC